jgi:hypothetical protein
MGSLIYLSIMYLSINCPAIFEHQIDSSYTSSSMEVEHSVPQGSVLGLLLFLLYINDVTEYVQGTKLVMFANDTSMLTTPEDQFDLQHKIINVMGDRNMVSKE